MSHAICGQVFDSANLQNGQALVERTLKKAQLRRHSDYVSRVLLLATPHFADCIADIAQWAVGASNCMNIWGGCFSGLVFDQKIHGKEPAMVVMVLGEQFEALRLKPASYTELKLAQMDSDHGDTLLSSTAVEHQSPQVKADVLGLLSYGANYAKNMRIDHGRLGREGRSELSLATQKLLVLNSEGLTFLSEAQEITESNGLFLIEINGLPAAAALNCPPEQTRPVGLRLQVELEKGEMWIPVMSINVDGTLSLAAPVLKGQRVRLAKRAGQAIGQELKTWAPIVAKQFPDSTPELGFIVAGLERTQLCHEHENDVAEVIRALPRTQLIGVLGQAAWLEHNQQLQCPPRNNRLCVALFNPPPLDLI